MKSIKQCFSTDDCRHTEIVWRSFLLILGLISITPPVSASALNSVAIESTEVGRHAIAPSNDIEFDANTGTLSHLAGAQITITGKLFYNDLRSTGRQDLKRDTLGNVGSRVPFDGSMTQENLLGAHKVVADFYEIDAIDNALLGCESLDYLGASTIQHNGHFEFTIPANTVDSCSIESNVPLKIGIRYRLRLCNDLRCMSVINPQNSNNA